MNHGAFILTAVLCLAATRLVAAECRGDDLFRRLEAEAPASLESIAATARALPFGSGKLFRLTRGTAVPSYLFGTLHLADPRVTDFSPRVRDALAGARIVALETTEIGAGLGAAISRDPAGVNAALLAPADRRADRLLGPQDFASLETMLVRRGLRRSAAGRLKAPVLALLVDLPRCAVRQPRAKPYADELIATIARENAIPVIGLEKLTEQLSVLDDLPRATERDLLVATLRQDAHAEDIVETTIARYEAGDIGGLLAWMRSEEPVPGLVSARTPPAFLDRLITSRNRRMRERALPLLAEGGAFIAVGAAHLPGEEGILRLLEENGYRVEVVE